MVFEINHAETYAKIQEREVHMLQELEYLLRSHNREEMQEKGIIYVLLACSIVVYFFAAAAVAAGN